MFTATDKTNIQQNLAAYCKEFASQAKAATSLQGVSEATVIQILKGNWNDISESMWVSVSKQILAALKKGKQVDTLDSTTMIEFFSIAREEGANFPIIGPAGAGKTFTADWYISLNRKQPVYHIKCSEYWNKKIFLSAILQKMGIENSGYNVPEMMSAIVGNLRRQHQPLLIIDELDKVSDNVLYFYISLYNELSGLCGIVILGTDYLKKRIERGVVRNTKGFKEIYSRLGGKFIELDGTDRNEVTAICKAHGLTDEIDITEVYNSYKGDLRVVERQILKHRIIARKKNQDKK